MPPPYVLTRPLVAAGRNPPTLFDASLFGGAPAAGATGLAEELAASAGPAAATGLAGRLGSLGLGWQAGLAGVGGTVAGMALDPLVTEATGSSRWGNAAAGAASLAPVGAVLGNAIPIPGVGAVTGGLAGALIGGVGGFFGGGDGGGGSNKLTGQSLADQLVSAGLPKDVATQAAATYNAYKAFGYSDNDAKKQAITPVTTWLNASTTASTQPTSSDLLGAQVLAANYMSPYVKDIQATAAAQEHMTRALLPGMPEGFRQMFAATIPSQYGLSRQIADAYALQIQAIPYMQAQENALRMQQQALSSSSGNQFASTLTQLAGVGAGTP